jgi:hypothetical protein
MFHVRPAHRARACRPRLEILEDRTLPSTFLVDHLADDTVGSGLTGSLRYAITNATDNDHITFGVTGTINLTGGLPNLTHSISIDGPGANLLTVRRNTGDYYRIFTVDYYGPTVSISGLTINNGVSYDGGYYDGGGGIFNGGTLTLANCTVNGNYAYQVDLYNFAGGGGIFNAGILTVNNSTISGNTAQFQTFESIGGFGGGIYNFGGTLTLSNSTVAGNHAGPGSDTSVGGGIYNEGGTVTLNNSAVSGNSAFHPGGIFNYGDQGDGTVTLNNSAVSGNPGGGIANAAGGTVTLNNSTVSRNSDDGYPGILNNGSTLTLNNVTVSGNIAGVSNFNGGTVHARNTIIAGNTYGDLSGNLGSLGHNLIGNTQGGSGFDPTDLLNVDPLLGPLQDNGGPTQTQALLAGSPAIDAGDPNFTGPPDWDQRGEGYPRISGGVVDIGAFEVQEPPGFSADFPSLATAGDNDPFTVTALDANGNPDPTYTGTVHFRSGDPRAVLPDDYTFTAADEGVHTFNASFLTAGTWTLIIQDTAILSRAGRQSGIVILPAAADHFTVSGTAGVVVDDSPFTLTVTAFDIYGNRATAYQGTVHFSSTDPQATLPDDYSFTAADAGSHPLTITLHTAGPQTVTMLDTVNTSLTIDQDIRVTRTVWLVGSHANSDVLRYDSETGAYVDTLIPPGTGGLNGAIQGVVGPDGNLYVTSWENGKVPRYDRNTGAYLGDFVTAGSGGLVNPAAAVFRDGYLYVSGAGSHSVLRYDAITGAFINAFVPAGSGGLTRPHGILFGPDGNLYVNSADDGSVMRYDGTTGAPLPAPGRTGAVFVPPHSGGLAGNYGQLGFGPDANLYVVSELTNNVLRYDGSTGDFLGVFVAAGSGGLRTPHGLAFGPDNNLYVVSNGTSTVLRYDGSTGAFLGVFTGPSSLADPQYLTYWDLDGQAPAPRPRGSHPHGLQSTPLAVLIGHFTPSFESASWNPWPVAALPSVMSGISPRAAPLAALVGGEFTLMTSEQQTLTADDAAGGLIASALLGVKDDGPPAFDTLGGPDSVDAFFAALAAEWSGHGHQSGAPALWGDSTAS